MENHRIPIRNVVPHHGMSADRFGGKRGSDYGLSIYQLKIENVRGYGRKGDFLT